MDSIYCNGFFPLFLTLRKADLQFCVQDISCSFYLSVSFDSCWDKMNNLCALVRTRHQRLNCSCQRYLRQHRGPQFTRWIKSNYTEYGNRFVYSERKRKRTWALLQARVHWAKAKANAKAISLSDGFVPARLESAYSLIWGDHEIWGNVMALLW